jgi:Ni/Fe-hydrogenase subunit HybB-like protein
VAVAFAAGCLVLSLKAWVMHSKSPKLVQRALLAVVLSLAVRAFTLVVGLLWAVKAMDAPGTFLLGFLCVYAMQLVLENGYLLLEQKRQSSPLRENE